MTLAAEPEPPHTFNPIDVLVEDALGDTVELFTDFIDNLLTSGSADVLRLSTSSLEAPSAKRTKLRESYLDMRKASFDSPVGSPVSPIELGTNTVDFALPPAELSQRDGGINSAGLYSRKNKPQRCSVCKECGHKSRTCKWAPGRMPDSPLLQSSAPSSPGSTNTSPRGHVRPKIRDSY
mmetsp:Transcript_20032/g.46242  ORF Transcript_20032/g.46242 Transcript_20032/m.46242 type:complete len:179 (-) Transcript_20032:589-1125(-)